MSRHQRWRLLKDRLASRMVAIGGSGVIIAIVLIFFYLLYVVLPLFKGASMSSVASYPAGDSEPTLHFELEEQAGMAVRYTESGRADFFDTATGSQIDSVALIEQGQTVTALATSLGASHLVAIGLQGGEVKLFKHKFAISYPNDKRTVTPQIEWPYGTTPLEVLRSGEAIRALAVADGADNLTIAAVGGDGELELVRFHKQVSFLDDSVSLEREAVRVGDLDIVPSHILVDPLQERLYTADRQGQLLHYDVRDLDQVRLLERVQMLPTGQTLTALRFMTGGYSLLVGSSDGGISQWFPVRDANNLFHLQHIRDFHSGQGAIDTLSIEQRRKGFIAGDRQGRVGLYHATAHRTLLVKQVADQPIAQLMLSPRADAMLALDQGGTFHFWRIHNEHPEISWSSLWGKVHYEGYEKPAYIWQSSSANNDFEPKFSLTPLTFGTLKAAFYAMMVAVPLAIMGAIFTAYFMAPGMRRVVKPTIEIMEALPTVILGFLAGLWLAPAVEEYLPGFFALLLFIPLGVLLFTYFWQRLPQSVQRYVPEGWEAALLVPVVIFLGWLSIAISIPLEQLLFDGNMRGWLTAHGIAFDQRNSLVVGLAMGFAVIPTIFSIAEDAIFSVPKHLTYGSLALGATPWQTLTRVVLLTASPGIFSAVMIGLGRAVGETMIVLMATGNTPVMDFSIFQGMRTLSANVAVEMPESEVDSTHYRVLFLAALTLFLFTFIFNTVAEIIRQRLRRKYSSL